MAKNSSSDVARTMAEQRKLLPAEASSAGHQFFNQLMGQQSMTQRWQRGEITNFYYLMYLNTLAGRSYNDLSQYPVFPWILADYNSEKLNLTNPATFRDLSKPMGAQSTKRLLKFLKRYNEWDDPTGDTPSYMFGTHYSSAMIVLSYLVRLEPFTKQFLKLQVFIKKNFFNIFFLFFNREVILILLIVCFIQLVMHMLALVATIWPMCVN